MPYRLTPFINESYYHVFNRGINRQNIFHNPSDYFHFIKIFEYYQFGNPKPSFSQYNRFRIKDFTKNSKIININCYCLMPNHFHLLLKQKEEGGIQEFMRKALNSYTKYYNTKNNHSGPILQGEFKAVLIETDEQLLHLSRYIHLNPYVNRISKTIEAYPYSSYLEYIGASERPICSTEPIIEYFNNSAEYKEFVSGHSDYARDLIQMQHLLIDTEE